jgi:uncharacterized OB-fold protein
VIPRIEPYADPLTAPFWEATRYRQLRLPACPVCHAWQWYPLPVLPCHPKASHQWIDVPGTGRVFSFTTQMRAFLPEVTAPHTMGLVELEGVFGPKLITAFVGFDGEPQIGEAVSVVWQDLGTHVLPTFGPRPSAA